MIRVLTHSVHTGYEYLYRHLAWDIDQAHIYQKAQWYDTRPLPDNVTLIPKIDEEKGYDFIIAHTLDQAVQWEQLADRIGCPLVVKLHTYPNRIAEKQKMGFLKPFVVVLNEAEQAKSWRLDKAFTALIPFVPEEWGGWTGEVKRGVYVGNEMRNRGGTWFWPVFDRLPMDLYGFGNPEGQGDLPIDELKEQYRRHRVFVNMRPLITMATLEAMATGCPVVSVPFRNRRYAFGDVIPQARSRDELVRLASMMLEDQDLAEETGLNQRDRLMDRHTVEAFVGGWTRAADQCLH